MSIKTNSADQKMSLLCPVGAPNYFSRGAALVVEMNAERGRHAAFILVISGLVICGLTAYFSDHNSPTGHKDWKEQLQRSWSYLGKKK